jgi:hypothetical protein
MMMYVKSPSHTTSEQSILFARSTIGRSDENDDGCSPSSSSSSLCVTKREPQKLKVVRSTFSTAQNTKS